MAETARRSRAPGAAPAWDVPLPDEAATHRFARFLAGELKPGDIVALSGELGAGKTTLARAIIRALAGDETLEVPSPTFTLIQSYDTSRGPVVHADLHRARAGRGRAHRLPQRLRRGCGATGAGPGHSFACRDERLGRGEARAAARRCLDASLRAARQADRRNGDPDDLAAAAGRPGGAARQALQRDREARRVRARLRGPR